MSLWPVTATNVLCRNSDLNGNRLFDYSTTKETEPSSWTHQSWGRNSYCHGQLQHLKCSFSCWPFWICLTHSFRNYEGLSYWKAVTDGNGIYQATQNSPMWRMMDLWRHQQLASSGMQPFTYILGLVVVNLCLDVWECFVESPQGCFTVMHDRYILLRIYYPAFWKQ